MEPYNFCSKAVEDLRLIENLYQKDQMPISASLVNMLGNLLPTSVKFILPEGGLLFDNTDPTRGEIDALKLPFESVAAEFLATQTKNDNEDKAYRKYTVIKRIALAFECGRNTDFGVFHNNDLLPSLRESFFEGYDGAIIVWPIDYDPQVKRWMPCWCGIALFTGFVPKKRTKTETNKIKDHARKIGISSPVITTFKLPLRYLFLGEEGLNSVRWIKQRGLDLGYACAVDTGMEETAIRQMCAVLNCSNIEPRTVSPSPRVNRKRLKKGKRPLFEYKILEVKSQKGTTGNPGLGGTHASPRMHVRRGHIRRLPSKQVWVQPCVVGNQCNGSIKKDYRMSA